MVFKTHVPLDKALLIKNGVIQVSQLLDDELVVQVAHGNSHETHLPAFMLWPIMHLLQTTEVPSSLQDLQF